MLPLVGNDTITGVTAEAGGRAPDTQPPSADAILDQMKAKDRARFDALARDLPAGMALAPVLYVPIKPEENRATWAEFQEEVEPRFLKHLAVNHADELRQAGIEPHGIERMARGYYPETAAGEPYNFDVDHIVERGGSGRLGLTRSADAQLQAVDPSAPATLEVNHIANFVFLSREVHDLKNQLNRLQIRGAQEPTWMLMLVPDRETIGPSPVLTTAKAHAFDPDPSQSTFLAQSSSSRAFQTAENGAPAEGVAAAFQIALDDWDKSVARWARRTEEDRADRFNKPERLAEALHGFRDRIEAQNLGDVRLPGGASLGAAYDALETRATRLVPDALGGPAAAAPAATPSPQRLRR